MADKRIKDLSTTATEADLTSGNYIPIDGSAGTKKLPGSALTPKGEFVNVTYKLNALTGYEIDGSQSTTSKDYACDFPANTKFTVTNPAANAKTIYLFVFNKNTGEAGASVVVAPGATVEVTKNYPTNKLRIYQSEAASITYSIACEGVVQTLQSETANLKSGVANLQDSVADLQGDVTSLENNAASFSQVFNGLEIDGSQSTTSKSYLCDFPANTKITITNPSANNKTIYLFVYNKDTGAQGVSTVVIPGATVEVVKDYPTNKLLVYQADAATINYTLSVEGRFESIENIEKNLNELTNEVDSLVGMEIDGSQSETSKDYACDLPANTKIAITNPVANNKTIYLFVYNKDTGSQGVSTAVASGTTAEVVKDYPTNKLRVYQDTAALIEYALKVEGVIEKLTSIDGELVSLGDSYCASGKWQEETSKKRNLLFNKELNNGIYSVSATTTLGGAVAHAQYRAKRMVSDNLVDPKYIVLENVNDANKLGNVGTSSDEPYFIGSEQTVAYTAESKEDAETYFQQNISTILSGISASHGHVVKIPYSSGDNASKITLLSAPSVNGSFTIRYGSVGSRTINVSVGDSISDVIAKITEFYYNRFDVETGEDFVLFTPAISAEYLPDNDVTITSNTSGINFSVQNDVPGYLYLYKTFPLHDMTNWLSYSSWIEIDSVTLWSAYKGLVNYLASNYPKARIVLMFPIAYDVDTTSQDSQYQDGSLNTDYILTKIKFGSLKTFQQDFCEAYKVPFIDVEKKACIYPENVATYFPANNYHPNDEGYKRWGEAVAELM